MANFYSMGNPYMNYGGSLYDPMTGYQSRDLGSSGANNSGNMSYLGGSPTFNERNPGATYPGFGQPIDQEQPSPVGGSGWSQLNQGPSQGMTGQNPFRNPYRQQNPFTQQPVQTGQYQGGFGQQSSMGNQNPFSGGLGSLFGGMGGYGMGYNPMQSMYGNPYMSSYGMGFNPMMGMYGMGNYNPYATMMSMSGFNPFAGQQNVFNQNQMGVPYGSGSLPTSRLEQQMPTTKPLQIGSAPAPSPAAAPAPAMPAAQQAAARPAATPSPFSLGGGNPIDPATYQKQVAEETAKRNKQLAELDAYQVPTSSRWYQYLQNPSSIGRMSGETDQDLIRRIKGNAMEEAQREAWKKSVQTPGGAGMSVAQMAKGGLTSLLNKFRK